MATLHWLRVLERIKYKYVDWLPDTCSMDWCVLLKLRPVAGCDLVLYTAQMMLPNDGLSTVGSRSLSVAGPI
jgi:hypothetical protein